VEKAVERREHPRTKLRLPVDCVLEGRPPAGTGKQSDRLPMPPSAEAVHHGLTLDLSPRGVYFETDSDAFACGMRVRFDLTVPPGEGHSPYQGRIRGQGEVLRVEPRPLNANLPLPPGERRGEGQRFGVAARFSEPVEFLF
jgi:hypothetical protein